MQENMVVRSHDVNIDKEYAQWIAELKVRYRSAQAKAAVRVNAEKLLFNWELGRDLVQKKAEERWGAGVVEQVSLDLRREFPDADGFSTRNLSYMKQWYLFYATPSAKEKLYQLGKDIPEIKLKQTVAKLQSTATEDVEEKLQRPVAEFPLAFALVPWGQHREILSKCTRTRPKCAMPSVACRRP